MSFEKLNRYLRAAPARIQRNPLRAWALAAVFASAAWMTASAQEGHPLKGSWLGAWESNEVHGESLLLILDWDGENITGIINPGTDDISITDASLDPNGWLVHIEADAEDDSGSELHYVLEGRIENLELPNRSIVGTWRNGQGEGDFDVSRQ